jgi:hypothetical protein
LRANAWRDDGEEKRFHKDCGGTDGVEQKEGNNTELVQLGTRGATEIFRG